MNLAYQSHSKRQSAFASLYIVEFNIHPTYKFHINDPRQELTPRSGFPEAQPLTDRRCDGSYASLDCNLPPKISEANLGNALQQIQQFNNTEASLRNIKTPLAQLIIATAEAVRFKTVEENIEKVLRDRTAEYNIMPHWQAIHHWKGNGLGLVIE